MRISISPESIEKSTLGSITGIIFVEFEDGYKFPGDGWYDFPVVILGWWLDEAIKLVNQTSQAVRLLFMDGPEFMRISTGEKPNLLKVSMSRRTVDGKRVIAYHFVRLEVIVSSLITAANEMLQVCRNKNWTSKDITFLQDKLQELLKAAENSNLTET